MIEREGERENPFLIRSRRPRIVTGPVVIYFLFRFYFLFTIVRIHAFLIFYFILFVFPPLVLSIFRCIESTSRSRDVVLNLLRGCFDRSNFLTAFSKVIREKQK